MLVNWVTELRAADPVKYQQLLDDARAIYMALLLIPFGSRERLMTDSARARARDLLSELEMRASEEVQNEYEAAAFATMRPE